MAALEYSGLGALSSKQMTWFADVVVKSSRRRLMAGAENGVTSHRVASDEPKLARPSWP